MACTTESCTVQNETEQPILNLLHTVALPSPIPKYVLQHLRETSSHHYNSGAVLTVPHSEIRGT